MNKEYLGKQNDQEGTKVSSAFNFDMNEEFSPDQVMHAIKQAQFEKEQRMQMDPMGGGTYKKTKKQNNIRRPSRLSLEITFYNRAAINFIFVLMFALNLTMGLDVGAMAAACFEIKREFNLDNLQFGGGMISTLYLGIFVAQIFQSYLSKKVVEKMLLCLSILMSIAMICALIFANKYAIQIYLSRFLFGFFQSLILSSSLAWIDTFGLTYQIKTVWLQIFSLTPYFSFLLSYLMTSLLVMHNFSFLIIFYAQAALLAPCLFFVILTPERYFDLDTALEIKRRGQEQSEQHGFMFGYKGDDKDGQQIEGFLDTYSTFGTPTILIGIGRGFKEMAESEMDLFEFKKKVFKQVKRLLRHSAFIFFGLALAGYSFTLSGLQLFITDYALFILSNHEDKKEQAIVYMNLGLTISLAPLIGSLIGGYATTKVNGASSPQALGILCLIAFFTTVVALPIPFVHYLGSLTVLLALLFCFLGFIMPILHSQLQYTLYQNQRPVGNALASILFTWLGWGLSPMVYGIISRVNNHDKGESRYPMGITLYAIVISSSFLFIALISKLKYRKNNRFSYQESTLHKPLNEGRETIEYFDGVKEPNFNSGESLLNQFYDEYQDNYFKTQQRIYDQNAILDSNKHIIGMEETPTLERFKDYADSSLVNQMGTRKLVQAQKRRESDKTHQIQLSNYLRLKYGIVHNLIMSRSGFMSCQVLGVVNEDLFFYHITKAMGTVCLSREPNADAPKGTFSIFQTRYEAITEEEAYIIYREQSLGLHTKLIDDFEMYLSEYQSQRYLTESQYLSVLTFSKLLPKNEELAQSSIFWQRFYQKFEISQIQRKMFGLDKDEMLADQRLYDRQRILIGLSLLTGDSVANKARVIFSTLSKMYHNDQYISAENVRTWITIYLTVACNYLLVLADDYPKENKTQFLKMFKKWNENLTTVADYMTDEFLKSAKRLNQESFLARCQTPITQDLFNTITLRKLVNQFIGASNSSSSPEKK